MRKLLLIAAATAILVGGWFGWKAWNGRGLSPRLAKMAGTAPVEMVPCSIWFPSREGLDLCEESSTIPKTEDPTLRLKGAIEALHRGPTTPCSLHMFPEDSAPRAVFLGTDGTAYLDYPKSVFERPMGLREEFLFIRALGKTLLRNCPKVRAFVILVDGVPKDFISGHMPSHGKYILPARGPEK